MFQIRPYAAKDAEAVKACFTELQRFEHAIEPNRTDGTVVGDRYLAQILDRCAKRRGKIVVAEEGSDVVGYACVWIEHHPDQLHTTLSEYAYIMDLVVLPDFRGRGIGKALLQAAEDHARSCGVTAMTLTALANNASAIEVYKKSGFEEYEMIMRKKL